MDVSALMVRLLARPIRTFGGSDESLESMRHRVLREPNNIDDARVSNGDKAIAWFMLLVFQLPLAFMLGVVDDHVSSLIADIVWNIATSSLVICALVGVSHAIRAGIAYKSTVEQWELRRRWLVPGNSDVTIAASAVILLAVAIKLR